VIVVGLVVALVVELVVALVVEFVVALVVELVVGRSQCVKGPVVGQRHLVRALVL